MHFSGIKFKWKKSPIVYFIRALIKVLHCTSYHELSTVQDAGHALYWCSMVAHVPVTKHSQYISTFGDPAYI